MVRIIGVILVMLGLLGFIFDGAISYRVKGRTAESSQIVIEKKERHMVPIRPLASGAAILGGTALIAVSTRRK